MATGDKVGADAELRRLLLLAPADAWAWVILGNLNFRQNFSLAERYFRRAVELAPHDPYAWNGMGVMYSEKRDFPRAISAFESALRANPRFAHAHLGLAAALSDSGQSRRAFEVLEELFATSTVDDTRALPTFEHASRTYREFAQRLADETLDAAETEVESLTREAKRVSGCRIEIEDADLGSQVTAVTQTAWLHGRDHHVIRLRQSLAPR
jgi:tetratricopeptide (TPR) repeat protein